jgi:hypothetical protein
MVALTLTLKEALVSLILQVEAEVETRVLLEEGGYL